MSINPKAIRGPVTAVPVVAGKGIRFVEDVENNMVVAEVDETVLWDCNGTPNQDGPYTLSEAYTNFEYIKVKYQNNYTSTPDNVGMSVFPTNGVDCKVILPVTEEDPQYKLRMMTLRFSGASASIKSSSVARYQWTTSGSCSVSTTAGQAPYITQIIGINRIANN